MLPESSQVNKPGGAQDLHWIPCETFYQKAMNVLDTKTGNLHQFCLRSQCVIANIDPKNEIHFCSTEKLNGTFMNADALKLPRLNTMILVGDSNAKASGWAKDINENVCYDILRSMNEKVQPIVIDLRNMPSQSQNSICSSNDSFTNKNRNINGPTPPIRSAPPLGFGQPQNKINGRQNVYESRGPTQNFTRNNFPFGVPPGASDGPPRHRIRGHGRGFHPYMYAPSQQHRLPPRGGPVSSAAPHVPRNQSKSSSSSNTSQSRIGFLLRKAVHVVVSVLQSVEFLNFVEYGRSEYIRLPCVLQSAFGFSSGVLQHFAF